MYIGYTGVFDDWKGVERWPITQKAWNCDARASKADERHALKA